MYNSTGTDILTLPPSSTTPDNIPAIFYKIPDLECLPTHFDRRWHWRCHGLCSGYNIQWAVCSSTCYRVVHRRHCNYCSPLTGMALFRLPRNHSSLPFPWIHLSLPVDCQQLIFEPQLSFCLLQSLLFKLCMGRRSHTFIDITEFHWPHATSNWRSSRRCNPWISCRPHEPQA